MSRRLFILSTLALLVACSSSTKDATDTPFTIAPTTANVGTCRTQQFTATPGDGVTWTTEGSGTVANGLYSAPISVPAPNTSTVKATRSGKSATATVTLATAFPGAPVDVVRTSSASIGDYVHGYAANGARVYALNGGGDGPYGVSKSTDGGLTWTAGGAIPTGDGYASSIAVDPANPELVYAVVHRGDKNAEAFIDLAVSTDGGATFTAKQLFDGGNGDALRADVVAPAADHVVLTFTVPWQNDGNGEQGSTAYVLHSADRGASWGTQPGIANGYKATSVPLTLETPRSNGMLIELGDGRYGSQLATNGAGKVCVTYADYDINGARGETHYVRCSTDSGASWSAPAAAAVTGRPQDIARPQIAISRDGQVIAIVYNKFADSSLDELGQTAFKVSIDGGATFGAEKIFADVPDPAAEGSKLAVRNHEVFIDGAGVIWFIRQVGNGLRLQLDKSCDKGATLSGAIDLPIATPIYNPTLFGSAAGMFAGGIRVGAADSGPTLVQLLGP